jgi:hypothetical protein
MNLNDAQKQQVSAWIQQGLKLADIQNRLAKELDIHLTYMEVRFLIDDLKLTLKDPVAPKPAAPALQPPAPAPASATEPDDFDGEDALPEEPEAGSPPPGEPARGAGKVSVEVDKLARPGAIVSGKVTFSDGKSAEWHLDQFGRLGLMPKQEGHRPSQADVMEFQRTLQNELAKMGF